MAQTPEGKVKDKLVKLYKAHGAWYDRAVMNGMGRNGRPDDLVRRGIDGHFGGIEVKKESVWRVSDLQRVQLCEIAAGGGSAIVCNMLNLFMVERWLQKPGCQLVAVFGSTHRTRNTVQHHIAYVPGFAPVVVKNPGDKPGK
jgi:hypothetical protein